MGNFQTNVLDVVTIACPRSPALRDCAVSLDRQTDTVQVDVTRLRVLGASANHGCKVATGPNLQMRAIAVAATPGDSESTAADTSPIAEEQAEEAEPSQDVPVEEAAVGEEQDFLAQIIEAMSRSQGEVVVPRCLVEPPQELTEAPQGDVDACCPSQGEEEAADVSSCAMLDAADYGGARQRLASQSSEEEPECEDHEALSSRAPSPNVVPSPGILVASAEGTLLRPPQLSGGGGNAPLKMASNLRHVVLDEGRLRRASRLFARMLQGEAVPRARRRRWHSAPPPSEAKKENRLFSLRASLPSMPTMPTMPTMPAMPAMPTLPSISVPRPRLLAAPEGAPGRRPTRGSSEEPARGRQAAPAPLQPLNGKIPWFPPALPRVSAAIRSRSRVPMSLPWVQASRNPSEAAR